MIEADGYYRLGLRATAARLLASLSDVELAQLESLIRHAPGPVVGDWLEDRGWPRGTRKVLWTHDGSSRRSATTAATGTTGEEVIP